MSNCSCKCPHCSRAEEFDAKAAIEEFARQQAQLVDLVTRYRSEVQSKRPKRAQNERNMAAVAKIFGGEPTGEFPECCSIDSTRSCTGVLIHPRIVLTAAHCSSPARVRLNSMTRISGGELINVLISRRHRNFNSSTGFFDIRVLILQHPSSVLPVRVTTPDELERTGQATLVGFGRSEVGTGVKRTVTVNIHRRPDVDVFDPDREFVAGGSGRGTCDGDSGGPAYLNIDGEWKLAGLTSRGITGDCRDGAIFTRVDVHMDFIREIALEVGVVL